jgi:hypothetical protein
VLAARLATASPVMRKAERPLMAPPLVKRDRRSSGEGDVETVWRCCGGLMETVTVC